jgi:hypothetical protein
MDTLMLDTQAIPAGWPSAWPWAVHISSNNAHNHTRTRVESYKLKPAVSISDGGTQSGSA